MNVNLRVQLADDKYHRSKGKIDYFLRKIITDERTEMAFRRKAIKRHFSTFVIFGKGIQKRTFFVNPSSFDHQKVVTFVFVYTHGKDSGVGKIRQNLKKSVKFFLDFSRFF